VHGAWDKTKEPSMHNYFIQIMGRAKMLSYVVPERQLISDIMRHYPRYIQQAFVTSTPATILEAAEFLRSLDEVNKQEPRVNTKGNAGPPKAVEKKAQYTTWRRPEGNVTAMQCEDLDESEN
jgi:hypothetical protein